MIQTSSKNSQSAEQGVGGQPPISSSISTFLLSHGGGATTSACQIKNMKPKLIGSILLVSAALIWWRTPSSDDEESFADRNKSRTSSLDESVPASELSNRRQSRPRTRSDVMSLEDTLGGMELTITADRIGANSAEGAVLLHGPHEIEYATEELQVSHSTGDLVLLGPTVLRSPAGSIDVEDEDATVRVSSDGWITITGNAIVYTKPEE